MSKIIFGVFSNKDNAEEAVSELDHDGYDTETLVKLGIPELDVKVYEDKVKRGAIFVAVKEMTGRDKEISAILTEWGASQVKTADLKL